MATNFWNKYAKAIRRALAAAMMERPTQEQEEADRAAVEDMIQKSGLTVEEMNEPIVMVCIGVGYDGVGCGFTMGCRLGDFFGQLPGDGCAECGGVVLEDRKGKPIRRMPKADAHPWTKVVFVLKN